MAVHVKDLSSTGQNAYGDNVIDYAMNTQPWSRYFVGDAGMAEDTMRWGGAGAELLGLKGKPVAREAMLELAAGYSPDGKKVALCQNAGVKPQKVVKLDAQGKPRLDKDGQPITAWEGGHQVGYDCTYTAPKSVSFLMAIATPEERGKIIAAHRAAVNTSMEHMASLIETRRGKGGKEFIGVDGAVWVACDHATERENGFHLHTHNILFGVGRGEDGKWGTFESKELYRHQKVGDAIYMSHLAEGLRKLGYGIEQDAKLDAQGQDTGVRAWRVAGVSRDTEELFSVRQQQIHEAMKSGISKQQAWNQTRKSKDEPELANLFDEWKQEVASHGLEVDIDRYKGLPSTLAPVRSDEQILEALHETTAVVSEADIIWAVYQARAGQTPEVQQADLERIKQSMYQVAPERQAAIDQGISVARQYSEPRYAAEFVVKSEIECLERADARKDDTSVRVSKETMEEVVAQFQDEKGFTLSDEQSAAIEHLCVDSGGHAVMAGVAGAGKTTVAELYKRVFEANGQHLIGACQAKSAARKLEDESGIETLTIKSLLSRLDNDRPLTENMPSLNSKSVLVVDEAGMVDTEQIRRLMAHVDQVGGKLLLQGDLNQLQAINAGSGMALIMEKIGHAGLTEIRRQKDAQDRSTAESFYDRDEHGRIILGPRAEPKSRSEVYQKSGRILKNLEKNNCIDRFNERNHAMDACVSDWLNSPYSVENKLLLAHDHRDISALTIKVREALRANGTLRGDDHTFKASSGQGKNERVYDMSVAVGDRVRITKNDATLGVVNGDMAEVESIKRTKHGSLALSLRVEGHNDKPSFVVAIDTAEWNKLTHGYCRTVHGAQGQGSPAIFHFANAKMTDNQSALVAFTRLNSARGYRMYTTELEFDQIRNRLGVDRFKQNATQEGLVKAPMARLEPTHKKRLDRGLSL